MPITAATLRQIAGMSSPKAMKEMLKILADQEQADEDRKAKQRARTRRYRERHSGVTVTLQKPNGNVTPSLEKEVPPDPPKKTPPTPPKSIPKGIPKRFPKDELLEVLDEEHSAAVVEHRQRLGKAMTVRAAKMLANKFAQCDDPNHAADEMIANGWQGFDPSWVENRTKPNGHGKPTLDDVIEYADRIIAGGGDPGGFVDVEIPPGKG